MQQTEQWKKAPIGYISMEDNWPVEKIKRFSDQISKTVYQFYKLNWLRQNVKDQAVEKQ